MECGEVVFSGHAVRRMFVRSVAKDEVLAVIRDGEIIARYPDDKPLPAFLLLGVVRGRPLHVVVAVADEGRACRVVTVYDPDPKVWDASFRRRRSP